MSGMEKVTVRLPSDTIRLLRELVDRGDFHSMAEAVNCAVEDFIGERFSPEDRVEIIASPEEGIIEFGSLLHSDSDSDTITGELDDAVRAYVRSRMG